VTAVMSGFPGHEHALARYGRTSTPLMAETVPRVVATPQRDAGRGMDIPARGSSMGMRCPPTNGYAVGCYTL